MKILHTADWHIGQFKGPVVDGVNLRSQDTVKCLEYMVQVAIEEKPDIVCVSGDIFHQEQVGPVRYSDEMITATNIITSLAHFSKYVIVMRGTPNHDGAAQFRVLERMLLNIRNVDVVTEPGVIKTPWADIACLPGFDKQEFRAKFPGLSADEENLAWTKYISDIREKAKQHSELSLQLSEAEKDVIKYKNAKRTLDSYNEDSDRYQRIITKSKLRNEQIDSQISLLSSSVPTDLEYRLEELNRKKEELDSQQEKRYRASVA